MLVGNSMLYMEDFAINLSISLALIHNCDVRIDISTKQYYEFLKQKVLTSDPTLVPP